MPHEATYGALESFRAEPYGMQPVPRALGLAHLLCLHAQAAHGRRDGLLAAAGREAEIRPQLNELYDWFTEGFDACDLQEAKALLEATS